VADRTVVTAFGWVHGTRQEYGVALGTVGHATRLLKYRGLVVTRHS
jgi:hypothetical protein